MDHTGKARGKQPKKKALNRREKRDEEDGWTEANLRAQMTSSSKELDLSDKRLEQIPTDVFSIKDIEILDVSDNPLGSIPVNIASLSNLKEMRAAGCGIEEISGNISRCTYLSKVDLSRNPFITKLPVTLKQLHYLRHVVLSGCGLKSLPKNLTLLARIETLDLSNNELDSLPPDISGLKRLKVLILSDNFLESIPASVESLSHLHSLEMKRNNMDNSHGGQKLNVPKHLKTLDMEGNYSLKVLPKGLENLENLEELGISYCGIETLPDSIGELASVRRIHLAGNKLRALPAEIGNLLNLETLDLEGNRRLSGLPLSLYHLRKNLRDKQTGTNIGLVLDNCPALALPESEVAQGNVVSVLVELMSEDVLKNATAIVAAEVVEELIPEGLTENMVAVAEECVWDDLMVDVTDVAISDKECSLDIFQVILKEVMQVAVREIVIESVSEERVMTIMTEELLEETTALMTEELAINALKIDDVAWEVMQALLEEVPNAMIEGMARNTVHVDDVTREVMREMLEETEAMLRNEVTTNAVKIDDVAWEVMQALLEEVPNAMMEGMARNTVHVDDVSREVMREMLEETEAMLRNEVATDAVKIDDVAWEVMQTLLEEVPNAMMEGMARNTVHVDDIARKVMREMMEEAEAMLRNEVATDAVQADALAWGVMQEVLNETTDETTKSIALRENEEWHLAMGMLEDLLDEISKATGPSVALEVEGELRVGQTVPEEYDTQYSHKVSAAAHGMQYLDLPAGCRLSVPPGATDEDISVISAVLNPHGYDETIRLEEDELLVSDIIEMRPAGMKFSKPVKLKIPHSLPKFFCEKEFIVKTTEDLGWSWMVLDTVSQQEQGQWFVTVEVDHFSEFVVVARPREHCQRAEREQPSTLRSSHQTDVEISFPTGCVPYDRDISFKILPVDADTLTCAAMGEDGISGIESMSHIVKFCNHLSLNSPATIVLPLSPGEGNRQVRVLTCDYNTGQWKDVTSSVGNIVQEGSKVAFRTDRFNRGFAVLRCDYLEDPTKIVNMVIKNIRARQVRVVIFKKWKEPREEGVMTARIECVLSQMVEDRIVYAEQVEGFERQSSTPTPPVVMMEGEEICVIFEGSIRPVENNYGMDYTFYCERPRVLEFDVKLVDKTKGAATKVELYPCRLDKLHPWARRRKVRGPTIQKKPPTPPPMVEQPKPRPPPPKPPPPKKDPPPQPPPKKDPPPQPPPKKVEPPPPPPRPKPLMTTEITPPTAIICGYWLACQRFKNTLGIGDNYLSPAHDKCFCQPCHRGRGDQESYSRGNPEKRYARPVGWSRFGLSVNPAFADVQLRVFTDWHRAYHGTRTSSVKQILQTSSQLLMPGDVTLGGDKLGRGKGFGFDSVQVFVSPSIKYAGKDLYAEPTRFQDRNSGKTYTTRVAFQVCVRPGSYQVMPETMSFSNKNVTVDPLFDNKELEWFTKERGVHALYGLLVKLEADKS
ncbi:uncharacterized protein LOC144911245 [Branchiostoma floridae x Branchiostoma belcheri]